jgi:hypothetical protein
MRPEAAMVGNPENRAIALTFDDGKERAYLLYFQVLEGLFSSEVSVLRGLYTLRTLYNSPRKGTFFAHIFNRTGVICTGILYNSQVARISGAY